jgi:hypothetical protein
MELPRHSRFKPAAKKFRGYKVLAVEIRFSLWPQIAFAATAQNRLRLRISLNRH